ncbi:MAG TPA: hypothetical protein VIC05_05955 [Solirubrobacteraceae bacterium]|jgi:hypothetical protein
MRRGAVGELVEVIDAGENLILILKLPFRDGRVVGMVAYETPQAALAAAHPGQPPRRRQLQRSATKAINGSHHEFDPCPASHKR